QSLSTFSGHLTNIVTILRSADADSLVLLDELGAGTDPAEGAALARAILDYLRERSITTLATTHYSELKAYAHLTPDVQNASVEFDVESLAPTYRLSIGIPGRSNALAIATRLGLDRGIIDLAASFLSPEQREVEELLTQIQAERDRAAAARAAADQAREDARKLQRRLADEWRQIESQRRDILERAREQAETELAEVRRRLRRALAEAERQGGRAAATVANDELGAAAQVLSRRPAPAPRPQPVVAESLPAPKLRAGSRVLVASLGHEGELVSLPDERGEAEVTFGSFKMRVRADDLQPASGPAPRRVTPDYTPTFVASRPSPGMELDLRGARADEALERVDEYLNDAYLAGLKTVRLIHGKGTGALRQAVRQHLKGHSLVKDFDTAPPREGGEGVTLATLAS
ncbi:MAG: Smr/MutS family protein, partial [Chloroflexi bacterium]|nr:Smr/MutS family protein [Chloroflexota bacterium]